MTPSTISRIFSLSTRTFGTVAEVYRNSAGGWEYGVGFQGCLYEYSSSDYQNPVDPFSGYETEREAATVLAYSLLDDLWMRLR